MSTKSHYADYDAELVRGSNVLIVEARFYDGIQDALLAGAEAALRKAGVEWGTVTVPGALEIPAVISIAAEQARIAGRLYHGFVALGCVIRGETSHYDIVAGESSRALMDLAVRHQLAIGNGILTVENEEQAWERARADRLDKGGGAAAACLAMMAIKRRFGL
ncbi:6,7-dimethyl-8-ribityllumazine synthase [Prosthecomicrobium sp. N25]|uniref:6,7-dimethyl-8-ribityllumazine synthase n=1 Tax=Prosthecomicrobium sp. N25 TaxID=3129254 RepID=UPI0030786EC0